MTPSELSATGATAHPLPEWLGLGGAIVQLYGPLQSGAHQLRCLYL